jgi:MYXO-CTERM domain-containing protein
LNVFRVKVDVTMQIRSTLSKKSACTLALAVAAGAAAPSVVEAAPFLTVSIWGRVQGSGASFGQTVVFNGSEVVEYEIRVKLGAEDSVNSYAGATAAATTTTISNWIPSNGSVSPTSGLNQVRFNLVSAGAATFGASATAAAGWADAPGNSGGTPAGDRLDGLNLIRAAGNFDGIAPDESQETLTVASGVFTAVGFGPIWPTATGGTFTATTVLATLRWRNDANGANINYNPTQLQQTNSTTGTAQGGNAIDPIIIYEPLNAPEPGALGIIALGALACRRRRRSPFPA